MEAYHMIWINNDWAILWTPIHNPLRIFIEHGRITWVIMIMLVELPPLGWPANSMHNHTLGPQEVMGQQAEPTLSPLPLAIAMLVWLAAATSWHSFQTPPVESQMAAPWHHSPS